MEQRLQISLLLALVGIFGEQLGIACVWSVAVDRLGSPVTPAKQFSTAAIFDIGQTRALLERIGQEEIKQSPGLGLGPKLLHYGWHGPLLRLQLRIHDRLPRNALIFHPVVNFLDLLNCQGAQLRLDARRDVGKGWPIHRWLR